MSNPFGDEAADESAAPVIDTNPFGDDVGPAAGGEVDDEVVVDTPTPEDTPSHAKHISKNVAEEAAGKKSPRKRSPRSKANTSKSGKGSSKKRSAKKVPETKSVPALPTNGLAGRTGPKSPQELTTPKHTSSEGKVILGLTKSTNTKTKGLLVWSARKTIGCPVLVVYKRRLDFGVVNDEVSRLDWVHADSILAILIIVIRVRINEWQGARWQIERKSTGEVLTEGDSDWRVVDRRRLLLAGSHCAVFELVLSDPTVAPDSGSYFPIRLSVDVAGVQLISKSFFVLSKDALSNLTKKALDYVEKWFMDPDMALSSVVQSRIIKSKSLAAAFLKKHQHTAAAAAANSSQQGGATFHSGSTLGVVARFDHNDNEVLRLVESVYPVAVPMDSINLVISVSQIFHFTHESIQWVGELPEQEKVFSQILMPAGIEMDRHKLHVYGQILPHKGMYQHSNPRLKRPFELLCFVLKIVLACNGLPQSWLEEDGYLPAELDLEQRKFASYEQVFLDDTVFNVNETLETLAKSVCISKNGALVIDYSVVIPVLVNSLSDLHAYFSALSSSKLKQLLGDTLDELFSVQVTVTELGEELREDMEAADGDVDEVTKTMEEYLKKHYMQEKLHITQDPSKDHFVKPYFDLFETTKEMRAFMKTAETVLEFDEFLQSDLNVFRLCIRGSSGCGKTTVCKYISRLWAEDSETVFHGKFSLIIHVSLDALTTATYNDLEEILLEHVVHREIVRHSKALRLLLPDLEAIRSWMMKNHHSILWVFDGIEALAQYIDNPYNKQNVKGIYDAIRMNTESAVKHKLVTNDVASRVKVQADLFLMLRLLSDTQIDQYIKGFVGETRGGKIMQHIQKTLVISKPFIRLPLNLELTCAIYSADPEFHISLEMPLALLFDRLFGWLKDASTEDFPPDQMQMVETQVLKLAYQSFFKSKFSSPTVTKKLLNQIPREFRVKISNTLFFELVSKPKGLRFLHPRMQEFMAAKYLARENLSEEILARISSKIINTNYHGVMFFLVGLLRQEEPAKLKKIFQIIMLDARQLVVLGSKGVDFVFQCFEETNYDRAIRKHVISWFWKHFGTPKMQIWRSTHVINLLELILFKLARVIKVKSEASQIDIKKKAVDALGQLGVESAQVVQLLVRAAEAFPLLLPNIVSAIKELTIVDRAIVPVLLKGTDTADEKCIISSIIELRRIVEEGKARTVVVSRLLALVENNSSDKVSKAVLDTFAAWHINDDAAMPLVVRALQVWDNDLRKSAIAAVQYIDLTGPNVFYSEKVFGLLEEICSSSPELRIQVLHAFFQLGMESRFVLATLFDCLKQEMLPAIELCGQFYVRNSLVMQQLVSIVSESQNQKARRLSVDMIAYIQLPKYSAQNVVDADKIQSDINEVIDTLYGYGLSSKFVTQRVQRMAEKKRKSAHLSFEQFGNKYLRG